jgi:hypothetical protein
MKLTEEQILWYLNLTDEQRKWIKYRKIFFCAVFIPLMLVALYFCGYEQDITTSSSFAIPVIGIYLLLLRKTT